LNKKAKVQRVLLFIAHAFAGVKQIRMMMSLSDYPGGEVSHQVNKQHDIIDGFSN
jgi:hypothetical protein